MLQIPEMAEKRPWSSFGQGRNKLALSDGGLCTAEAEQPRASVGTHAVAGPGRRRLRRTATPTTTSAATAAATAPTAVHGTSYPPPSMVGVSGRPAATRSSFNVALATYQPPTVFSLPKKRWPGST